MNRYIDLGDGARLEIPDEWKVRKIVAGRPWVEIIDPEAQRVSVKKKLSAREKRRRLHKQAREICDKCLEKIAELREGNRITFKCRCRPMVIEADPGWPEDYDKDQARLFPA
jgi:hypothetical protein